MITAQPDAAGDRRSELRRQRDRRFDKTLRAAGVICNVVAVIALTVAVYGLTQITASRRGSAHDSCQLLRGLVNASTQGNPRGHAAARAFIQTTPLRDCNAYARHIIR